MLYKNLQKKHTPHPHTTLHNICPIAMLRAKKKSTLKEDESTF